MGETISHAHAYHHQRLGYHPQADARPSGSRPGNEVVFTPKPDGRVVLSKVLADRASLTPAERIARVRGIVKSTMTTDEIMLLLRGEPE